MVILRKKVSLRCACGKKVAEGSVFCSHCRAEVNRKNTKTMKKEERKYQREVNGKKRHKKRNKKK